MARSGRDSAERVAFLAMMNIAIRSSEPTRRSVENAPAPRASAAVTSRRVPVLHSNLIPQARFSHGVLMCPNRDSSPTSTPSTRSNDAASHVSEIFVGRERDGAGR